MYPETTPEARASLDGCHLRLAFGGSVSRAVVIPAGSLWLETFGNPLHSLIVITV